MKITNKSELMTAAWKIFRNVKNKIATLGKALKTAWSIYKSYLAKKNRPALTPELKELYKSMIWANEKVSRHGFNTDFERYVAMYNEHKDEFDSIWKFAAFYARNEDKILRSYM